MRQQSDLREKGGLPLDLALKSDGGPPFLFEKKGGLPPDLREKGGIPPTQSKIYAKSSIFVGKRSVLGLRIGTNVLAGPLKMIGFGTKKRRYQVMKRSNHYQIGARKIKNHVLVGTFKNPLHVHITISQ